MASILCIIIAVLLGSISSAWVIVFLFSRKNISSSPDGKISPATVHRMLGVFPFALAALMDILLAAAAVLIAKAITNSDILAGLAGIAAMIGHNWSVFFKFKGGQGATSMCGAIAAFMFWPLLCGLAVAAITVALTRKTTFATAVGVVAVCIFALLVFDRGIASLYPLIFLGIMMVKRYQLAHSAKQKGSVTK